MVKSDNFYFSEGKGTYATSRIKNDFRKSADSANAENYVISLFVSAFNFAMEFFMAVSKPFVTTSTL